MPFEEDIQRGVSDPDPELWTDSTLVALSLSNLSEALSEKLSRQRVLRTYIRWLEMHRLYPTPITNPWEDTLVDWAKSLRARGLSQKDLMKEVKIWKEENGPFCSPYRRYPPMPYDIAKAWPENVYVPPGRGSGKQDYSREPPGDYICNRCNKRGHFLEACPTNMDPAFDKPPNMNYCCPVCKEWGKHYKSLCPKNMDPYSITQKRSEAGIKTPGETHPVVLKDWDWEKTADQKRENSGSSRGRSRVQSGGLDSGSTFRSSADYSPPDAAPAEPTPNYTDTASSNTQEVFKTPRKIDDMKMRVEQLDEVGTDDVGMIRNKFETSPNRVHIASPDSAKTLSRRLMNEKSPSPTKARILRSKIAAIEIAERREGLLPTIEQGGCTKYTAEKAFLLAELYEEEHGGRMNREYDIDNKKRDLDGGSDDIAADSNAPTSKRGYAPSTKRPKLAYWPVQSPTTDNSEDMDVYMKEPIKQKPKIIKYHEFIRKLIHCHPEMKEAVNQPARRPTALDMWNDDDDRRFKIMSISRVEESPSKASMSSFDDEPNRMAEDVKEPMDESSDEYDPFKAFDTPTNFRKNEEDLIEFSPKEEDNLIQFS